MAASIKRRLKSLKNTVLKAVDALVASDAQRATDALMKAEDWTVCRRGRGVEVNLDFPTIKAAEAFFKALVTLRESVQKRAELPTD